MKFSLAMMSLCAAAAWAQPSYEPLAQVKEFLQLSDAQVRTILGNNGEYNRWAMEKQTRIAQVQREIAEETVKDPLDPGALGIRYAEIESICRQMKEHASELRARNLDALTAAQKTKLNVLEEAMKLAPVISQAQYGNLIGGFTTAPYGFTSTNIAVGGAVVGGVIVPATGCSQPFPVPAWFDTTAFQTGDRRDVPR